MESGAEDAGELPPPSPELALRLASTYAGVRFIERHFGKKAARLYLADISDALGMQEAAYNVIRFRPRSSDAEIYRCGRLARAWWRQVLGAIERMG